MKKILFMAALLVGTTTFAQYRSNLGPETSINLIGGARFSNFIFHNSEGVKSDNLSYRLNTALGVNLAVNINKNIIRPELMFHQAGAKSKLSGTSFDWKLNYLALNVGYLYSVVDTGILSLQPGLAFGVNYMVSGEQIIGNNRYNIIKEESLGRLDLEVMGLLNAKIQVTPLFSIGAEYRFGYGLLQIEKDIDQRTRNIGNSVLVHVGFNLGANATSRF